jgi:hypothetical protein
VGPGPYPCLEDGMEDWRLVYHQHVPVEQCLRDSGNNQEYKTPGLWCTSCRGPIWSNRLDPRPTVTGKCSVCWENDGGKD